MHVPELQVIQILDGQQENLFRPGNKVGVQPTQSLRGPTRTLVLLEVLGADPVTDGGQAAVQEAFRSR
jgi:hypothetical protein